MEISQAQKSENVVAQAVAALKAGGLVGAKARLYQKPVVIHTHSPIPGVESQDSVDYDAELVDYQFVDDSLALIYRGIEIYWAVRDDGSHYEYWFALYSGASDGGNEFDVRDFGEGRKKAYQPVEEWITFRKESLDSSTAKQLCYGIDADLLGSDQVPTRYPNITACRKAKRHNKVKDKDGYCSYCLTLTEG